MEITAMEYPGCPYCREAKRILSELADEHPEYVEIHFRWIDETEYPALAAQYDYYYAPSFFLGGDKLYEADPARSTEEVKLMLNDMLAGLRK